MKRLIDREKNTSRGNRPISNLPWYGELKTHYGELFIGAKSRSSEGGDSVAITVAGRFFKGSGGLLDAVRGNDGSG